ncbi:MAG: hypothetical protein WC979_00270 [Candidatus Pacearchaeota archaeon]|jgi:hypothetical protein|nr:hypothetical protein [Clostridia bacterium]
MAKTDKIFTIENHSTGSFSSKNRYYYLTGTLAELIKACSYTLECGKSWEHERGNKKINMNPKTVAALCVQLNNAKNNSAANGYSGDYYSVLPEGEPQKS